MRYLRMKDYSEKTSAEAYVFMNDKNVSTLPSSWTLEFFVHCNIATSNTTTLPIMNYKLFPTETATDSEDCITISISSTNLFFKVGSTTKTQSNINNKWNHIVITYQSTDSIIIYVNATQLLSVKVSSLSFKNYPKFDKFLFTLHKGDNNICYAGIQVYKSIKYDSAGFAITLPDQITYGDNRINEPIIDVDGHVIDYNELEQVYLGNANTYNSLFINFIKNLNAGAGPKDINFRNLMFSLHHLTSEIVEKYTYNKNYNNRSYMFNKNLEFMYFLLHKKIDKDTSDNSFYLRIVNKNTSSQENESHMYGTKIKTNYIIHKEEQSTAKIYMYTPSTDTIYTYTKDDDEFNYDTNDNNIEQIFSTEDVNVNTDCRTITENKLIYADIDIDDYQKNGFTIDIIYKHIGSDRHPLLYAYEIIDNGDGTETYPDHNLFNPLDNNCISNTCGIAYINGNFTTDNITDTNDLNYKLGLKSSDKPFIVYTTNKYENSYVHYYIAFKQKQENNEEYGGLIGRVNGKSDFTNYNYTNNKKSILDVSNSAKLSIVTSSLTYGGKITSSFITKSIKSSIYIRSKNQQNLKKVRLYLNLKKDDSIVIFSCKKYFNPNIKSFEVARHNFGMSLEYYKTNDSWSPWMDRHEYNALYCQEKVKETFIVYDKILPNTYKNIALLYPYDTNDIFYRGHSSGVVHDSMQYFFLPNDYYIYNDTSTSSNLIIYFKDNYAFTGEIMKIQFNTTYNKIGYPVEYQAFYPIECVNTYSDDKVAKYNTLPARNTLEFITIHPKQCSYEPCCVECWVYFKVLNNTDTNYYDIITLSFIDPDLNITLRAQPSSGKVNYIIAKKVASKLINEHNYDNNNTEYSAELINTILQPNQWNHIAFLIGPNYKPYSSPNPDQFEIASPTYKYTDTINSDTVINNSDYYIYCMINNVPLMKKNYYGNDDSNKNLENQYNLLKAGKSTSNEPGLYAIYLQKILLYMRNEYSSCKLLIVGLKVQYNASPYNTDEENLSNYFFNQPSNLGRFHKKFNLEKTK